MIQGTIPGNSYEVTVELHKSKETFNLDDDKVRSAFGNYFIKNGMSGNARMLEEEMFQKIRDKKIKPYAASTYALSAFFAATEVKYHTRVSVLSKNKIVEIIPI